MERDSGLWVPASVHKGDEYEEEEDDEEETGAGSLHDSTTNGDGVRGRQETAVTA